MDAQTDQSDALQILKETSRTFFIPISRLPAGLLEAVASAYLCLRAIDEIEDHPELDPTLKVSLLRNVSHTLQASGRRMNGDKFLAASSAYRNRLPEVSVRLEEWVQLAPETVAPRIWDATAAMAERMAGWVACDFAINNEDDLECYTFGVAGAVGLLLSDLWAWYDSTQTNRLNAIGFGRGLQAVNILRNRADDLNRGVDFFPDQWDETAMQAYARRNLGYADDYLNELPPGPAQNFCKIPLALAYATLEALSTGQDKLARSQVLQLIQDLSIE
jgi:farnesyl-diphosphate farnesyltransferase